MEHKTKLHPLVGAAALSVIGVSFAGIAVLTGVLPHPSAAPAPASTAEPAASTLDLVGASTAYPEKIPATDTPAAEPARPAPKARSVAKKPAPSSTVAMNGTGPATLPPPAAPSALPAPEAAAMPAPVAAAPRPVCADCGTIETFREIQVKGDGSPVGAVAGGAAGALLGHQFGRGSGKDLLTIAGAVGGAFAGHEIERNVRKKTRYEVSVRMEDGSLRTVTQDAPPAWHVGERVRVVDQRIVASS